MKKVLFSGQSKADIREIAHVIRHDNPLAASRWVLSIEEKCARLAQFPRIGRRRDGLAAGLLSFPAGNYLIFYRIAEHDRVEVVRVLHAARDVDSLLG